MGYDRCCFAREATTLLICNMQEKGGMFLGF